jgi:hypothetical protein
LCPPFIEAGVTHPMLTTKLGHRNAAFGLAQDREDLGALYLVIFISISSCILSRQIPLPQPLSFGRGLPSP